MRLSKSMQEKLNSQIQAELSSEYLYLSMAAYFDSTNLSGFSHWMRIQAAEERGHAMKFHGYVMQREGRVILQALPKPKSEWSSPLDVMQEVLTHEQKVTGLVHGLADAARKENDHGTESFLKYFVDEQVEEEASAKEIVDRLTVIGKSISGLMILDRQLAERK